MSPASRLGRGAWMLAALGAGMATHAAEWPDELQCRTQPPADSVRAGWCVFIDRGRGDCLACHRAAVAPWPAGVPRGGSVGPELAALRERFPERAILRGLLWDPAVAEPRTAMPPYGRNRLLDEAEIDAVVEFLLAH